MQFRTIGNSDLKVSTLGLGCNNFGGRLDEDASTRVIHAALDHGITLFDTADVYPMGVFGRSEEIVGRALGKRRDDVVVATKFGYAEGTGGSHSSVISSVEASLKRLGTDRIDLFQFHKPDPDTPVEETLRALDDLIRAGKVRYAGCSQFSAWQIVEAHFIARELGANRFISTQAEYSLLARDVEKEILPVCERFGVGLLPFFPLASGVLSGKYAPGKPVPDGTRLSGGSRLAGIFLKPENLEKAEMLSGIAGKLGGELIDLAFSYLLKSPAVPSVIAGASTPEQIARNARAAAFALSDDGLAAIRAALA
jgi:aryl-alcohol dehydrogenase-like predicted oxidoreductase